MLQLLWSFCTYGWYVVENGQVFPLCFFHNMEDTMVFECPRCLRVWMFNLEVGWRTCGVDLAISIVG